MVVSLSAGLLVDAPGVRASIVGTVGKLLQVIDNLAGGYAGHQRNAAQADSRRHVPTQHGIAKSLKIAGFSETM